MVFGGGVWATHFIAELAFRSGLPIGFTPSLTILSLGIAVAGSVGGFTLAAQPGRAFAAVGGAVTGAAIAAMHFTGMAAMRFPGVLRWDLDYVLAAVFGAIGCGALALLTARSVAGRAGRIGSTVLLVAAICGLHFTAMAAVSLVPLALPVPEGLLSGPLLAVLVAAVILPVLLVALIGAAFDHAVARRSAAEVERLRNFADATFEGILFHRQGIISDVNTALCRMVGETQEQLVGLRLATILPAWGSINAAAAGDPLETELVSAFGGIPVEVLARPIGQDGRHPAVVAVRDIAERKAAAQRIQFLAHHDPLTGLANRTLFHDRLGQALAMVERSGHRLALLCLDLDRFKTVNDGLGHPVGDLLLAAVGARLSAELREMDTVARLGGDEFAVVQPFADHPQAAAALARRLVDRLGAPFELDGHQVMIGTSIGIALYPEDGRTTELLLKHADLALFRAKQEGRGTFCFFEPDMDERLQRRRLLEQDLRVAIDRGHFEIHYQKMCASGSLAVLGYEALLRWRHPARGNVPPAEFIPIAEETGLIMPLGRWVLETACREAASWAAPLLVSVNISPAQFAQPDLPNMVGDILRETGLAADRLELEITEGILINNTERALAVLGSFKELGVRVTLDDFGTGYSSLGYLRRFPFDAIKIDRSFVHGLGMDHELGKIVQSILALCGSLGLQVTAEGVETDRQLEALRGFGCGVVQGFLLGRPVAAVQLTGADALAVEREAIRL